MRTINRRSFLRLSGGLASGTMMAAGFGSAALLSACGREDSPAPAAAGPGNGGNKFGLQLYTLRDVIGEDPRGVLAQVASFGYKQIESYEGPQGIYWGMGNTGFKQYMDDLGMSLISSHVNNFNDFESFSRKVDEAAEVGVKYLICPYAQRNSLDEYRKLAEEFNRAGEICRNAGLRFAYHNHGYTFEQMDGQYPQDLLMQSTDADLVDYELDIYWVAAVNADPAQWLRKYPGRFVLSHVKDIRRNGQPQSTTLGTGAIDWPTLLPLAREQGMEYFIVEQEDYEGTTPLEAVRDGAEYMRSIDF
jgi:sugar phosphate isomerase/epimerase